MTIDGIIVHKKKDCQPPCPFHAPSDHPLKDAPIHIRVDKGCLVERICEHGVGHDDPDSVAYMQRHGVTWAGVHGCDGCCKGISIPTLSEDSMHDPRTDNPSPSKGLLEASSEPDQPEVSPELIERLHTALRPILELLEGDPIDTEPAVGEVTDNLVALMTQPSPANELNLLDTIDNWYHKQTRFHLVDIDPSVMQNLIAPLAALQAGQRAEAERAGRISALQELPIAAPTYSDNPLYGVVSEREIIKRLEQLTQPKETL